MPQPFDTAAFDRATDPLLQFLTREQAEALTAYRATPELRQRIDELASRNTVRASLEIDGKTADS